MSREVKQQTQELLQVLCQFKRKSTQFEQVMDNLEVFGNVFDLDGINK